jgi:hypothetical protein
VIAVQSSPRKLMSSVLRREVLLVSAAVALAFVAYAVLAHLVEDPRIFVDENRYMDAAGSLADGHGLRTRGQAYGWSPGYPAALAPLLALSTGRPDAYFWIKLANAGFFAVTAVPVYLLARRLLPRIVSGAVILLAFAIPSSVYVGLVLTESLAYFVFSLAVLAFVLAVERPTEGRQLTALLAVAAAYLVRSQFAVLYPAYLAALSSSVVSEPAGSRRKRLLALWPSGISLAIVSVVLSALLASRGASALGRYDDLWRSYGLGGVVRWLAYHAADLGLYLGLFPLVFLPAILGALHRRDVVDFARRRAFLFVFAAVTGGMLLVTAAFASTPFSEDRLHDRYLFYVVPLWLIAGAVWIRDGAPRSRAGLGVGVALLVLFIAVLPFDRLVADDPWRQLEAAGTPAWSRLASWTIGHGLSGHRAIGIVTVVVAVLAVLLPRRLAWTFAVPVAAAFLVNGTLLWHHSFHASRWHVFADRSDSALAWVDGAVPSGAEVTVADLSSVRCPQFGIAYPLTEFYNGRIGPVAQLSRPPANALPTEWVKLGNDGRLVDRSGRPLVADWVVLPPGVRPQGRPVAEGTRGHLVLWRVPGVIAFGAGSELKLSTRACEGLRAAWPG